MPGRAAEGVRPAPYRFGLRASTVWGAWAQARAAPKRVRALTARGKDASPRKVWCTLVAAEATGLQSSRVPETTGAGSAHAVAVPHRSGRVPWWRGAVRVPGRCLAGGMLALWQGWPVLGQRRVPLGQRRHQSGGWRTVGTRFEGLHALFCCAAPDGTGHTSAVVLFMRCCPCGSPVPEAGPEGAGVEQQGALSPSRPVPSAISLRCLA